MGVAFSNQWFGLHLRWLFSNFISNCSSSYFLNWLSRQKTKLIHGPTCFQVGRTSSTASDHFARLMMLLESGCVKKVFDVKIWRPLRKSYFCIANLPQSKLFFQEEMNEIDLDAFICLYIRIINSGRCKTTKK